MPLFRDLHCILCSVYSNWLSTYPAQCDADHISSLARHPLPAARRFCRSGRTWSNAWWAPWIAGPVPSASSGRCGGCASCRPNCPESNQSHLKEQTQLSSCFPPIPSHSPSLSLYACLSLFRVARMPELWLLPFISYESSFNSHSRAVLKNADAVQAKTHFPDF